MKSFKVFLVSEDVESSNVLASKISAITNVEFKIFQRGRECIEHLSINPALIFIDYHLSDPGFDSVMRVIHSAEPSPNVVILANKNEVNIANELMRDDVHDIIVRESTLADDLLQVILRQKGKRPTNIPVATKVHTPLEAINFVGNSPAMSNVMHSIEQFSENENLVWIQGSKSTGKETVARMIHANSKNSNAPFVKVDVEHLPQEHLKSALFGIAKVNGDRSYFDRCDNGTIYIENVDKLSRDNQMHLFSAISKHSIYDDVNAKEIKIKARVIVSSMINIEECVRTGTFHESLFKLLLMNKIEVPDLKLRGNDVVHIAQKLLNDYCRRNNIPGLKFSQDACHKIADYSYPGNINELKSIVEFAAVLAENNMIQADAIVFNSKGEQIAWISQDLTLEEFNSKLIHHYLNKYNNKVKLVADKLQIGKSTIYRMLQKETNGGAEDN